MYGILGIVVNEASRVQTKHDLSFKSLLQNSPYRKDVLRIFAMLCQVLKQAGQTLGGDNLWRRGQ